MAIIEVGPPTLALNPVEYKENIPNSKSPLLKDAKFYRCKSPSYISVHLHGNMGNFLVLSASH